MRDDEQLEEKIDAALRSYAEPGDLCEPRVALARLRARAGQERSGWSRLRFGPGKLGIWMSAAAGAFGALVLIAGLVWVFGGPAVPQIAWVPGAPRAMTGLTAPATPGRRAELKVMERGWEGSAKTHPNQALEIRLDAGPGREVRLPKLEVFPTPQPLSPEEQALVAFAASASPELKREVIEGQGDLSGPITIAELKIQPLDEGDSHNKLITKEMK